MKISCEIIKDLLPLYHDQVCSEESNQLVEEHLKQCNQCKKELEKYNSDFKCSSNDIEEAKTISKIAEKWRKDKKVAFAKGSLILSVMASFACIIVYNIIGTKVMEDGTLVEAFGFIPLAYLFALFALISFIALMIFSAKKKKI